MNHDALLSVIELLRRLEAAERRGTPGNRPEGSGDSRSGNEERTRENSTNNQREIAAAKETSGGPVAIATQDRETALEPETATGEERLSNEEPFEQVASPDSQAVIGLQANVAQLSTDVKALTETVKSLDKKMDEVLILLKAPQPEGAKVLNKNIIRVLSAVDSSAKVVERLSEKIELIHARSAIGIPEAPMTAPAAPLVTAIYPSLPDQPAAAETSSAIIKEL
ncbi:uncharacterized protein LOC131198353 [Ahaetulla prasina]|uniref:uncharacterized protein LOC131198353 n=1 Tax=Ahaetulla prasina TaxID=499056 RepID=UPI00264A480A|nr:uncharacterized protein LOC131198353 [Ahaetulla prasina]